MFGDAWVYGNAQVCDSAWVFGDAQVFGNAQVCDSAWVYDYANVSGGVVSGETTIGGYDSSRIA